MNKEKLLNIEFHFLKAKMEFQERRASWHVRNTMRLKEKIASLEQKLKDRNSHDKMQAGKIKRLEDRVKTLEHKNYQLNSEVDMLAIQQARILGVDPDLNMESIREKARKELDAPYRISEEERKIEFQRWMDYDDINDNTE